MLLHLEEKNRGAHMYGNDEVAKTNGVRYIIDIKNPEYYRVSNTAADSSARGNQLQCLRSLTDIHRLSGPTLPYRQLKLTTPPLRHTPANLRIVLET
jgi:hypothetical protein